MDPFSHLSVLLSVIVGLAVTEVLQAARGIVLTREPVRLYVPVLIWAIVAVLAAVQSWWASFGLRLHADWSFAAFLAVISHAISIYVFAGLVLPDAEDGKEVDLRRHYQVNRRWIFGALLATTLLSLMKQVVLTGGLPAMPNLAFHLGFCILAVLPLATGREAVQQAVAPAGLALMLAYVVDLFWRL